jgi:hypothetical protein
MKSANRIVRPGVILLAAFVASPVARAERAPVDRDTAKFVVEGVVESVEKSEDGEHDWFLVRITLTKVEKGDKLKAGDVFKATCYRLVRPKPKTFASAGHSGVPVRGDKIRAFVSNHDTHGGYEGVYPEWFDKLEVRK